LKTNGADNKEEITAPSAAYDQPLNEVDEIHEVHETNEANESKEPDLNRSMVVKNLMSAKMVIVKKPEAKDDIRRGKKRKLDSEDGDKAANPLQRGKYGLRPLPQQVDYYQVCFCFHSLTFLLRLSNFCSQLWK